MNPRAHAARLLQRVIHGGNSLTAVLQDPAFPPARSQERALVHDLCFGTLRWYWQLAIILAQLLNKPLKAADKDMECLLLVGLYQLLYQRVPDHAAVHATVDACKALGKGWASKLVNGVLRNFLRQRDKLLAAIQHDPSSRYAFPAWLLQRWQQAWPDDWEAMAAASNLPAPLTLRVNWQQHSTAEYLALLQQADLTAQAHPCVPSAVQLAEPVPVDALPGFASGAASVQDAAAQLAAFLLDAQPKMRVLDACAAPGGKTAHLLELTPTLQVTALDSSAARLQRLEENLARLRLTARVVAADAAAVASWWDGQPFDRILLDAPCSATGVIRRHPDIKLLRRPTDIAALQQEQAHIMDSLWSTLQIGGKLLYVTCSVLPEENHLQVQAFLQRHPGACVQALPTTWGRAMPVGRQILPGEQLMDGFYYALVAKNK